MKLVWVVSFYDNSPGGPIPYYAEGMGGDGVRTLAAQVPTVPTGENTFAVTVSVVYEIK